MATKQEIAAKHEATIAEMRAQVKAWSSQLDDLVAGYLEAGAQSHDAYRIRIDALRERLGAADVKLGKVTDPSDDHGTWGAFRAGIKEDWTALEEGLKDLTC